MNESEFDGIKIREAGRERALRNQEGHRYSLDFVNC